MFRGEFIGLNGGADFYAKDIDGLRREGETSLKVFPDMCREDGVEPGKEYSGRFNLRVPPEVHAEIAAIAAAAGIGFQEHRSFFSLRSLRFFIFTAETQRAQRKIKLFVSPTPLRKLGCGQRPL
jgi:predicted HicB family RNase H-like nuclease